MNWAAFLTVQALCAGLAAIVAVIANPFLENRKMRYAAMALMAYATITGSVAAGLIQ